MTNDDNIERFKKIVDAIFDDIDNPKHKAPDKKPAQPSSAKKKLNIEKVDAEEDEPGELGVAEETVELVLKELDDVREAFLKFQEEVEELAIFQFLFPEIEEFVEFCLDLVELVEDDFDVESLDAKSLEQYQKMQKLRARILSAAYMKYKKE
jgi:hypothetical protein